MGGQRVPKDGMRIEAYGTVDELNSFLGAARSTVHQFAAEEPRLVLLEAILLRVQHELFNLGSILATLPEDVHPRQPRVTDAEIAQLEAEMDLMNEDVPALRSFVLPGGSRLDAELHICRTVCRRAERMVVTLGRERERAAGSHPLPEPFERCFVRLEPVGRAHCGRARNALGAQPVGFRAKGFRITTSGADQALRAERRCQ